MRSTAAFAGDLALLLRRHRREAAAFLAFTRSSVCSVIHVQLSVKPTCSAAPHNVRSPVWFRRWILHRRGFWFIRGSVGSLFGRFFRPWLLIVVRHRSTTLHGSVFLPWCRRFKGCA